MSIACGGKMLIEKDGRRIIQCRKCGYAHVFPMYSENELERFYEDLYAESTPSYVWHEKVYNTQRIKKKRGSILDIGCWEGAQLEFFKKEGWRCTGTELNKRAASVAKSRGIEVHRISIEGFFRKFPGRKWDVINAAYILEHISHPLAFLKRLKKNLKRDGMIIVEVPNEFSPFQLAYLKKRDIKPYWVALPDHLNYFNKEGIEGLVRRAGYRVIHAESSFPMEMFLLMGDDYLSDRSLGKTSFKKVVAMEDALREHEKGLVSGMYSALYRCGIGRSIILYIKARS